MKRLVHDFGNVKLAVLEQATPERCIRTVTQIVKHKPTAATWARLERALKAAREWAEAQ